MNIKAKKSLGQNFLIDHDVLEKIVTTVPIANREILEIGPGSGNLTQYILKKKPKKIYVIEKDTNLSSMLTERFNKDNNLDIINDDVLTITENKISKEKLTVFGNLPYNISTEILSKWIVNLDKEFWFTELILMFQKEVADRIIAKFNTSNYGRLAIITAARLKITNSFEVSPNSFYPIPKVKSTVLVFEPFINENFKVKNIKNLEEISHIFFSRKRKMINKAFNKLFKDPTEMAKKLNINLSLRPNELTPNEYFKIVKLFEDRL